MNNNNEIDELFSRSLSHPDIPFSETDWATMKQKLEKDKSRRGIIWWIGISGAAAALLITVGWWSLSLQSPASSNDTAKAKAIKKIKSTEPLKEYSTHEDTYKPNSAETETKTSEPEIEIAVSQQKKYTDSKSFTGLKQADRSIPVVVQNQEYRSTPQKDKEISAETSTDTSAPTQKQPVLTENKPVNLAVNDTARIAQKVKSFKPSLILSLTAAPDVSAVKSFNSYKLGISGGLLATITLSPRLSISSGAVLSKKIYGTGFANYNPNSNYTFTTNPVYVNANCQVIDVPLNVNYTFLNKDKSALQFTAGISSYIMLTENYEYEYASHYTKGPYSYHVRNLNKHYFGVTNLALAYQHKLNNHTSIGLQPYLKLPLTEIGYGNVKLLSAGAALNLNMNISSIIKGK